MNKRDLKLTPILDCVKIVFWEGELPSHRYTRSIHPESFRGVVETLGKIHESDIADMVRDVEIHFIKEAVDVESGDLQICHPSTFPLSGLPSSHVAKRILIDTSQVHIKIRVTRSGEIWFKKEDVCEDFGENLSRTIFQFGIYQESFNDSEQEEIEK